MSAGPSAPPGFASLVLAPNPGPMTLDGTNTWVLRAPGSRHVVVVDPGPAVDAHLEAVAAHGDVALVLLTHGHLDHSEGAPGFHRLTGAPVAALDAALCHDADPLADGTDLVVDGLRVRVLATPGHSGDSVTFVADDGASTAVLTGDTILGRGTTVIDVRDGTLVDYLASLHRLIEVGQGRRLLPAHGPDHADAAAVARRYLAHREERLDQIRGALEVLGPDAKPMKVVKHVYSDVDPKLWPAAKQSVKAQLEYLRS